MPDCGISTDLFTGFHGETEEDFARTLDLMREVGFDSSFHGDCLAHGLAGKAVEYHCFVLACAAYPLAGAAFAHAFDQHVEGFAYVGSIGGERKLVLQFPNARSYSHCSYAATPACR